MIVEKQKKKNSFGELNKIEIKGQRVDETTDEPTIPQTGCSRKVNKFGRNRFDGREFHCFYCRFDCLFHSGRSRGKF